MNSLKYKYYITTALFSVVLGMSSCLNDLDTIPLDKDELVSEVVFGSTIDAYEQSLAKIYAGLAIGGNQGGDAEQDVAGIDGGSQASFLRVLWNMQELTSDMAHCAWTDPGIPDFNQLAWSASSPWIKGSYYRLYYQINVANAFLRETVESKLNDRGCSEEVKAKIREYRAEARFLRAMCYGYAIDLYRNVPFVTEESPIGNFLPTQIMAKDLFDYVEKELVECIDDLPQPIVGYSQEYGHATKAAAWAMLARLYLNAEVYIGENKYTECIQYCNNIISAGFELEPEYGNMFRADNHLSKEMIFPVRYEGEETMTWGGMTAFLNWGDVNLKDEVNGKDAWQGVRAKSSLLRVFNKENASDDDKRKSMLRTELTTNVEITVPTNYLNNGIPVAKYYNVNSDGTLPPSKEAYTDFPLFRLGEVYLNYAEAVLRGGANGDRATALKYINDLRKRAYNTESLATIADSELTLDFILDERGRELFYEAHRRTDLIRFNKYTSGYNWPWKGGVAAGRDVEEKYKVFPIPSDDIGANANLTQNDGY